MTIGLCQTMPASRASSVGNAQNPVLLEAVRAPAAGTLGVASYRVVSETAPERRRQTRRRVRLQTGKLAANARFLCDCRVVDRSGTGLQLAVSQGEVLPERLSFFDDRDGSLRPARIVWRSNCSIGLALASPANNGSRLAAQLSDRLYAL